MMAEEMRREIARLDYENYKIEVADRLRYQVEFAHGALKGLTITNGGAIIALFTFIGGTAARFNPVPLWWAFGIFALGIAATLTASIGAYFSQGLYMRSTLHQLWNAQSEMAGADPRYDVEAPYRIGERFEYLGVGAAMLALLTFIAGSACALAGVLAG